MRIHWQEVLLLCGSFCIAGCQSISSKQEETVDFSSYKMVAKIAPEGVAAYVDDERIMRDEVKKIETDLHFSFAKALDFLIEQKLLYLDFKKKGGKISKIHVDIQLDNMAKDHFKGNKVLMQNVLKQQGQSLYGMAEDLRNSMMIHAMQQQQMQSPFSVSPRQMFAYYKAHQTDFQVEAQYCLQQSGFPAKEMIESEFSFQRNGKTETFSAIRMTKEDRWKELMAHQVPLTEIQKHLDTFHTEPIWYAASELDPQLLQALSSLSEGQTTPYLLLNGSYVCSTIIQSVPAHVRPLLEVQEEVEESVLISLNEKNYQRYLQRLRDQASITIFSE